MLMYAKTVSMQLTFFEGQVDDFVCVPVTLSWPVGQSTKTAVFLLRVTRNVKVTRRIEERDEDILLM